MSELEDVLSQLATTELHAEDRVSRTVISPTPYPADPWCAMATWTYARDPGNSGYIHSQSAKAYGRSPQEAEKALVAELRARVRTQPRKLRAVP